MARKIFRHRSWLNKPNHHGDAFISAEIKDYSKRLGHKKNHYTDINGHIHIADCTRKITLDFGVYDNSNRGLRALARNNIRKLDKIISVLQSFRERYVAVLNQRDPEGKYK